MTLLTLIIGENPIHNENVDRTLKKLSEFAFDPTLYAWEGYSKSLKELVQQLLSLRAYSRITAKEAMKHNWFIQPETEKEERGQRWGRVRTSIEVIRRNVPFI